MLFQLHEMLHKQPMLNQVNHHKQSKKKISQGFFSFSIKEIFDIPERL